MIDYTAIKEMATFETDGFPVTSLNLNTDGSRYSKKEFQILLKAMIRDMQGNLKNGNLTSSQAKSFEIDIEKIQDFIEREHDHTKKRGLAIFSCSGKNWWRVFTLHVPIENKLVVNKSPDIRNLVLIINEYKRYCTVLLDREKARVFEVFMGEIEEHTDVFDEVPGKVKVGGWSGYESKRIERHVEDHVQKHIQHTADITFDFFKRNKFDRLILGGRQEILSEFEGVIHSYLKERIVSKVQLEPTASLDQALKATMEIDLKAERTFETSIVNHLLNKSLGRGLGVVGFDETALALKKGQVHMLIIDSTFERTGSRCAGCGLLTLNTSCCLLCGGEVSTIDDVVNEAMLQAVREDAEVEVVFGNGDLIANGGVGAILRFKSG